MKKTKELPKEFTFICDEHSREQLIRLGVRLNGFSANRENHKYLVLNNTIEDYNKDGEWLCGYGKDLTPISLSDYIDQPETKPTKWRFKTQDEFEATYEKDEDGDYMCGGNSFVRGMFHLFGKEYKGSPENLIMVDDWIITPEMLMPLEEEINATEQKWQNRTRGGYEYVIYEEFDGKIFGRMKSKYNNWYAVFWFLDGSFYGAESKDSWDLLPLDPHAQRKAEIKSEIERLQKELESLK